MPPYLFCFFCILISRTNLAREVRGRHQTSHVRKTGTIHLKRPSHGKLKFANSCWQTQVGVCERHKNSQQTRLYLTPTVCKRICRLFLCCSHTPTWVCQHEFANLSLPCEGRLRQHKNPNWRIPDLNTPLTPKLKHV